MPKVNIKKLAKKASITLAKVYKKIETKSKKPKRIKKTIKTKSQIRFLQKLKEEKQKQKRKEKFIKLQAIKERNLENILKKFMME